MTFEAVRHAKNIYNASLVRALGSDKIVEDYATYTNSQFKEARQSDTIRPLVIPARNEEEDLPSALLTAAQNPDVFPLILDNQSSDETATIARKMGAGVINVDQGNKMAATQEGLRAARHELGARAVLLSDADVLFPKQWAGAMHTKLVENDKDKGAAVFGNSILWHGPSRTTDIILSAAKMARAAKQAALNTEVIARGHNYAVLLDPDGQMEENINRLDPTLFGPDDWYVRNALIESGANVINDMSLATTVLTRNDRVQSIAQRLSRNYGKKRQSAYDEHYDL